MKKKKITFSNKKKAMSFFNRLTALGYGVMAFGCNDDGDPWTVKYFLPIQKAAQ